MLYSFVTVIRVKAISPLSQTPIAIPSYRASSSAATRNSQWKVRFLPFRARMGSDCSADGSAVIIDDVSVEAKDYQCKKNQFWIPKHWHVLHYLAHRGDT